MNTASTIENGSFYSETETLLRGSSKSELSSKRLEIKSIFLRHKVFNFEGLKEILSIWNQNEMPTDYKEIIVLFTHLLWIDETELNFLKEKKWEKMKEVAPPWDGVSALQSKNIVDCKVYLWINNAKITNSEKNVLRNFFFS